MTFSDLFSITGLSGTITSICYIPLTKVLWVLCGSQDVSMFDPKSGYQTQGIIFKCAIVIELKEMFVNPSSSLIWFGYVICDVM